MYTLLFFFFPFFLSADSNPIELGKINWNRNYDTAIQQAIKESKPVFILFQEVPGCSTCRQYGQGVLSHPFIVEAIEDEFIPLAIFNNKNGHDSDILKRFHEPSWNNPVARIVDQDGQALADRVAGNYSELAVVDAITSALTQAGREVPNYLSLYREQLIAKENEAEVALSMYCFWSGEKEIASIKGVVATEAGFMDGKEVVKVRYNKKDVSAKTIANSAAQVNCADGAYVRSTSDHFTFKNAETKTYSRYRKDVHNKYYLYNSNYKYVPMLPIQELKVNRALATNQDPDALLSPRQLELLDKFKTTPKSKLKSRISIDFVDSWYGVLAE